MTMVMIMMLMGWIVASRTSGGKSSMRALEMYERTPRTAEESVTLSLTSASKSSCLSSRESGIVVNSHCSPPPCCSTGLFFLAALDAGALMWGAVHKEVVAVVAPPPSQLRPPPPLWDTEAWLVFCRLMAEMAEGCDWSADSSRPTAWPLRVESFHQSPAGGAL